MAGTVPARLTAAEGRTFAFTVGAAFLVLAAVAWWREHPVARVVLGGLGGVLLAGGLLVPTRLGPVQRAWMGLAHALSKVTTPIVMAIVYFAVVTPIGLLMRAIGRRTLVHVERDGSYWTAPPSGGRSDITHQF